MVQVQCRNGITYEINKGGDRINKAKVFKCNKCGHTWRQIRVTSKPKECIGCKSRKWAFEKIEDEKLYYTEAGIC